MKVRRLGCSITGPVCLADLCSSHIQPVVGEEFWPVSATSLPPAATLRRRLACNSSRCYSTPLHPLRRTIAVLRQPEHDLTYTFLSSIIITDLSQGKAEHSALLQQHRRTDEETVAIATIYPEDTDCCFGAEDWASPIERVARMRWSPCLSSASSKAVRYDPSCDRMEGARADDVAIRRNQTKPKLRHRRRKTRTHRNLPP